MSSSPIQSDKTEEEIYEEEEEEEPRLKYQRLGAPDIVNLLKRDSASAMAVSHKFLVNTVTNDKIRLLALTGVWFMLQIFTEMKYAALKHIRQQLMLSVWMKQLSM